VYVFFPSFLVVVIVRFDAFPGFEECLTVTVVVVFPDFLLLDIDMPLLLLRIVAMMNLILSPMIEY